MDSNRSKVFPKKTIITITGKIAASKKIYIIICLSVKKNKREKRHVKKINGRSPPEFIIHRKNVKITILVRRRCLSTILIKYPHPVENTDNIRRVGNPK